MWYKIDIKSNAHVTDVFLVHVKKIQWLVSGRYGKEEISIVFQQNN